MAKLSQPIQRHPAHRSAADSAVAAVRCSLPRRRSKVAPAREPPHHESQPGHVGPSACRATATTLLHSPSVPWPKRGRSSSSFVRQQTPVGRVRRRRRAAQAVQTTWRRSIGKLKIRANLQAHGVLVGLRKPRDGGGSIVPRCWGDWMGRRGRGPSSRDRAACGHLVLSRRCARWRTGLQPQVHKDPLDHRRFESERDDLALAVAVRAVFEFEFDLEDPTEWRDPDEMPCGRLSPAPVRGRCRSAASPIRPPDSGRSRRAASHRTREKIPRST